MAFPLATPIHPEEKNLYYPHSKVVHHLIIISYTIIVVVPCQYLVHFSNDVFLLFKSHIANCDIHLLTFLSEFLACGFMLNSEVSISAFGAVMGKSEEVKCSWLLSILGEIMFCKSAKVDKTCLRLFQR